MDDNLRGSTMDFIIAEEGDPASGYFGGKFHDFANPYRVTSGYILKLNTNLCRKICITSLQVAISFSLVLLLHIYLWERKISVVENLYPYHVVLRTKAKDQQLRRSVKKKLSYTA